VGCKAVTYFLIAKDKAVTIFTLRGRNLVNSFSLPQNFLVTGACGWLRAFHRRGVRGAGDRGDSRANAAG